MKHYNRTKSILTQNGMSLISALIAASLMVIVGLAIASIVKSTLEVQSTIKVRDELDNLKILASAFLKNPEICKKSLLGGSGLTLASLEKEGGISVKSIVSSKGAKALEATDKIKFQFEPFNQDPAAASISPTQYMAQLSIRREKLKGEVLAGGGAADRILPVQLTVDSAGNIVSCGAFGEGSENPVDPLTNPRNCGGMYYSYESANTMTKDLEEELKKVAPIKFVNRKDKHSKQAETFEHKGSKYIVYHKIEEGAAYAGIASIADTSSQYESGGHRPICINGDWSGGKSPPSSSPDIGGDGGPKGY